MTLQIRRTNKQVSRRAMKIDSFCREVLDSSPTLSNMTSAMIREAAHDGHVCSVKLARARYLIDRKGELEKKLVAIEDEIMAMLQSE